MITSNLVDTMTRDANEFSDRGIDAGDISAFESLGNAFEIFPPDSFYQADVSIAADNKNITRADLTTKVRSIVQCAIMKWGDGSPQYRKFGTKKMSVISDMKFLTMCRLVVTTSTGYLADLSSVGLTQDMIDDVSTGSQTFEDNLNAINEAISIRDIKTGERVNNGNVLYSFVVKYCQIGKFIWDDVDETKYNDYVIYPKKPDAPGKVLDMNYEYATNTMSWSASPRSDDYELERKLYSESEWIAVYSGADTSTVNIPPSSGTWLYRCRGHNDQGYGIWSDEYQVIIPE
jgi:hypothetical protein